MKVSCGVYAVVLDLHGIAASPGIISFSNHPFSNAQNRRSGRCCIIN